MKINTMKYFISDALKSLKRNRSISSASMATVAATLFLLGVFLLVILNIQQAVKGVESKFEAKIFLQDDITYSQQNDIEDALKKTEGVMDVRYESKDEALTNFKDQLGDKNAAILEGLDKTNPMPNSYVVKVKSPEIISNVVDNVKNLNGVEDIQDGRKVIDQMMIITRTIRWVGLGLFVILIAVSLFLIGNTIKLTVYSRRREINIMKYIGATDWFIRWPFILEGMIIGIVGAVVSGILLFYSYNYIYIKAYKALMFMQLISPMYVLLNFMWIFLLFGIVIGSIGSILAIRKFLAV